MNTTLQLLNPQQAVIVIRQILPEIKFNLDNGKRLQLSVKPEKRTIKQNKRYWGQGVLAQITAQAVVNGKQYSAETWHEMAKRQFIGVIEMPDGSVRGMSSKDLDKAAFSEFCTKVEAWAATELGVVFFDLPKE